MICPAEKCTACYACMNICPKQCISMEEDEYGQIRPVIDESKCINCKLCQKRCPVNSEVTLNKPACTLAAYSKDSSIHSGSASGGISFTVSQWIIENNGIVYGSAISSDFSVAHKRAGCQDDLKLLRGSKYVHSQIENTYSMAKKDLLDGRRVLFTGTPCQIAGLYNYLGKEYENLYAIDVICHGTPSQKTLSSYFKMENVDFSKIASLSFRDRDGFNIKLSDRNNTCLYMFNMKNSLYYNGFLDGYIYRMNCYTCRYAQENRVGDITLGDFWGLDKNIEGLEERKAGINVVLINTEKGIRLWNAIKDRTVFKERTLDEAVRGNTQLRHPVEYSVYAKRFHQFSKEHGLEYALQYCNKKKYRLIKTRKSLKKRKTLYKILKKLPVIKNKI